MWKSFEIFETHLSGGEGIVRVRSLPVRSLGRLNGGIVQRAQGRHIALVGNGIGSAVIDSDEGKQLRREATQNRNSSCITFLALSMYTD
jgi:hypothetical protein